MATYSYLSSSVTHRRDIIQAMDRANRHLFLNFIKSHTHAPGDPLKLENIKFTVIKYK